MKKLIAQRPILFMGKWYHRGDAIPGGNTKMVEAWLRSGSIREEAEPASESKSPKKKDAGKKAGNDV